jgi:hypothetical protein
MVDKYVANTKPIFFWKKDLRRNGGREMGERDL